MASKTENPQNRESPLTTAVGFSDRFGMALAVGRFAQHEVRDARPTALQAPRRFLTDGTVKSCLRVGAFSDYGCGIEIQGWKNRQAGSFPPVLD
jgi:hypothetical protein